MSRTINRNNDIRNGTAMLLLQLGLSRAVAQSVVQRMPLMEIVALRLELEQLRNDPADTAANLAAEGT